MKNLKYNDHILILSLLATGIGFSSTLVAKLLILSLTLFTNLFYFQKFSLSPSVPGENHLGFVAIFVPVLGGLIVGLMARFGSKAIRGHGIPEAMENILLKESRIPRRVIFLKPLSAAISIGSGGPFGAEGPIIATGGALGSFVGRLSFITPKERKILLASGAAAGMSAIFGTPLSAVLLAIELLLFEFSAKSFIPVAIAAGVAATLRHQFLDSKPFLEVPISFNLDLKNMLLLSVGCILFGVLAVVATKVIYLLEDQFEKIPLHWMWWPSLGGLFVGLIGLIEPLSLGVGYQNIQAALSHQITVSAALGLLIWKFISWSIALSSGTSGGTLAPLLTVGSLSGMLLGGWIQAKVPEVSITLFALVGMAAVFAGASRSLLASVLFAVESTQQPVTIIPLLIGCSISYLVSHFLMTHSIMTEKIERRGVRVPSEYGA